jgi:hypothetical protein
MGAGRAGRRRRSGAQPRVRQLEDRTVPTTFNIANGDVQGPINAVNTANSDNQIDIIDLAQNGSYAFTQADNSTYGPNALPVVRSHNLSIEGNRAAGGSGGSARGGHGGLGGMGGSSARSSVQTPAGGVIVNTIPAGSGGPGGKGGTGGLGGNGGAACGGGLFVSSGSSATLIATTPQNNAATGGPGGSAPGGTGGSGGLGGLPNGARGPGGPTGAAGASGTPGTAMGQDVCGATVAKSMGMQGIKIPPGLRALSGWSTGKLALGGFGGGPPGTSASAYQAVVFWGDSTNSVTGGKKANVWVTLDSAGDVVVTGQHTYAAPAPGTVSHPPNPCVVALWLPGQDAAEAVIPVSVAANVTDQVTTNSTRPTRNPTNGLYTGAITFTNPAGASDIVGQFDVLLANLPTGVSLRSATVTIGTTTYKGLTINRQLPQDPFVEIPAADLSDLTGRESITLNLTFNDPLGKPIVFAPGLFAAPVPTVP